MGLVVPEIFAESGAIKRMETLILNFVGPIRVLLAEKRTKRSSDSGLIMPKRLQLVSGVWMVGNIYIYD